MADKSDRSLPRERQDIVSDGGEDELSLDRLFSALATARQRAVLSLLVDEERASRDEVASQLAAVEYDVPREEVTDDQREYLVTALHHIVLPKLCEADLVEYVSESGTISRGFSFERAKPYLELAHQHEDGSGT
ncbi:DUF7344 domain-containing protein [Halomarina litorea]|uniref:DUF7344 domain-containing protein n=1 Tax=Halomarina litorea TaxID=2961595 RepID=UPI0020C30E84|nr:hypothetical protein [Halomarina sp. BCD28]